VVQRRGQSRPWVSAVSVAGIGTALAIAGAVVLHIVPSGAALPPSLTVSSLKDLHSGQTVSVSVGATSFFTPNAHVNILECADPGGTAAHLPTSISTCDGNTVQGNTVLIAANGSFSEADYTVYALPNSALGEQANVQPACNQTDPCVLYVGQNQNDFTAPKVFSPPFTIGPASGVPARTTPTTATTEPTATTATTEPVGNVPPTTVPAAVSLTTSATSSATTALPNTGLPAGSLLLGGIGSTLVLGGSLGRRAILRVRR
jgi:hypothetical protein